MAACREEEDGWGLFSYGLYQHIRANTPQFEEIAAFQANEPEISVRRAGSRDRPKPFPANLSPAITSPPSAFSLLPDAC